MFVIYPPHAIKKQNNDKYKMLLDSIKNGWVPEIRACWNGDHFQAIEGSHRLAACAELEVPPVIIELDEADVLPDTDDQFDSAYMDIDSNTPTVEDILIYYAQNHDKPSYVFYD